MVIERGIEASPEQIKAILNLQSPNSTKDIQRLTDRVATLSMFISRHLEDENLSMMFLERIKSSNGQRNMNKHFKRWIITSLQLYC